jgi:hypothetical protein
MRRTTTVKKLRNLLHFGQHGSVSRFDRYYTGVAHAGSGYPTADEARRDLRNYDRSTMYYGYMR